MVCWEKTQKHLNNTFILSSHSAALSCTTPLKHALCYLVRESEQFQTLKEMSYFLKLSTSEWSKILSAFNTEFNKLYVHIYVHSHLLIRQSIMVQPCGLLLAQEAVIC